MGEDLELQSLENLLEKILPSNYNLNAKLNFEVEQEKSFTFYKRYINENENRYTQKIVFKSSIPWQAKIPWDYTSFPGTAELWSRARAGLFYRYSYQNFNFKSKYSITS